MRKLILTSIALFSMLLAKAQLKVYSSGNVAIGNTSSTPSALLDVFTSTTNAGSTRIADATLTHYYNVGTETKPRWGIGRDYLANGQAAIGFGGGGTSTDLDCFIGRDGSGNLLFQTNSASSHNTRLTVTSAGDVGFGTTSPTAAVEVASGNIYVTKASAYNALKFIRSSNSYAGSINFSTTTTDDWLIGERPTTDSDFHLYCYGTGGDAVRVQRSNAYVGLAMTPSYRLDVWGDINTWGNFRASGAIFTSDRKYKTNITSLSDALTIINKLKPSTYYWDTTNNNTNGTKFTGEKQYGLISQDVEQILPELISITKKSAIHDSSNNITSPATTVKGLNYIAFIPITIKAVQELSISNDSLKSIIHKQDSVINALQNTVNGLTGAGGKKAADDTQNAAIKSLQDQINNCCIKNGQSNNGSIGNANTGNAILYANVPNPFNQSTVIKCFIPDPSKAASLLIFDMNGTLKKTIALNGKGEVNTTINGKELIAGMYFYSLIIDGSEIDTKKMILTEQ